MIITEKIVDAITGEENFIEREETLVEKEERLAAQKRHAEFLLKEKETNAKRQLVLDKLGLTADEVAVLLG